MKMLVVHIGLCAGEGVLLVNCSMADNDRAIVRSGRKQWVKSVISYAPHCLFVMSAETKWSLLTR